MNLVRKICGVVLVQAGLLLSATVHAVPIVSMCDGGTLNVPPVISTSDVSLGSDPSVNATDCFYATDFDNANPSSETEAVNLTDWAVSPEYWDTTGGFTIGDANFTFADKSGEAFTDPILGVIWSITFNSSGGKPETGSLTISWSDPGDFDLPDYFDLVVLLKGASGGANGYLFDNLYIPLDSSSVSGQYQLNLYKANPDGPGNGNPFAGLSHSSLLIRAGDTPFDPDPDPGPDPSPIPEPGTLLLIGLGLAALRISGSRRRVWLLH